MSLANTIPDAVTQGDVAEKAVPAWVNDEARPILDQARSALNAYYQADLDYETAGTGVATTVWTSDTLPSNCVWLVEATVLGFKTGGASRACAFIRRGTFVSISAVVAQLGATSAEYSEETVAGTNATLSVSGSTVICQVTDDAANTFKWRALIRVLRSREE